MKKINCFLLKCVKKNKKRLKSFLPIKLLRFFKNVYLKKIESKFLNYNKKEFNKKIYKKGVNLIGPIKAEIGLGQSCRLVANELNNTNFKFNIKEFVLDDTIRCNDNSYIKFINNKFEYGVNLFHIQPYELIEFLLENSIDEFDNRYSIAFVAWELERIPKEWVNKLRLYDEIWTPSEFCSNSFRRELSIPINTIPYSPVVNPSSKYNRLYFNLPKEKFLFLIMYDSNSTIERKNPIAGIKAFKLAFKPNNFDVGLVIKINNTLLNDIEMLKQELKEYKNIYFISDILSKQEVDSLIKCVDVVVSLHCAEGFGLILAEAMLLGVPTIATNWSANTEFMNSDCACMVKYKLVPIKTTTHLYKKGSIWASADIKDASNYMKKLYSDKKYYKKIKINGYNYITKKLGIKSISSLINDRLNYIYEECGKSDKSN